LKESIVVVLWYVFCINIFVTRIFIDNQ